ncbi:unnamed protein product, partial [Brassica oleracea]
QTWFLANDPVYIMLTEKLKLDRLVKKIEERQGVNKWRPEYEDREEDLLLLDNNFCIT